MEENGDEVAVPDWAVIENENNEISPSLWLFIYDSENKIIRKIKGANNKGLNRISWDLSTESKATISIKSIDSKESGNLVAPGKYSAQLFKKIEGKHTSIGEKVSFEVKNTSVTSLIGSSSIEVVDHWENVSEILIKTDDLSTNINNTKDAIQLMLKAYDKAKLSDENLQAELLNLRNQILTLKQQFSGSKSRSEIGEKNEYPTIRDYIWASSNFGNTYGPTKDQLKHLNNAIQLYDEMTDKLKAIKVLMEPIEDKLLKIGAPSINK